ncbi:MAG: hypothetical protein WC242_03740 [Candidatus Paceibacterota bacterium]|jgi:predicted NAD-dependent protein-ADP-ribosyltransferase YbiA (DUF1768 family)
MDIKAKSAYPASALSNFAPHSFEIDGVKCASMEGFLQSLKVTDPFFQIDVCQLVGSDARHWGDEHNAEWRKAQTLWWQSKAYDRHSPEYQELLDRAFEALLKNEDFRRALLITNQETLTHSIGQTDPHISILTQEEFCSRLMKMRSRLLLKK